MQLTKTNLLAQYASSKRNKNGWNGDWRVRSVTQCCQTAVSRSPKHYPKTPQNTGFYDKNPTTGKINLLFKIPALHAPLDITVVSFGYHIQ